MTRRDWALAGAMLVFGGSGFLCWSVAAPDDIARTLIGAAPLAMFVTALYDLAKR